MQHPIEYTLIWIVALIVVCAPLAVIALQPPDDGVAWPSAPLSVCISGALGSVGRRLVEGVRDDPASRCTRPWRGARWAATWGRRSAAHRSASPITDDIEAALDGAPDVLIDYTHPSLIRHHLDSRSRAACRS